MTDQEAPSSVDVRFDFDFDPRYARWVKLTTGATPSNSSVAVTDSQMIARFGRMRCRTDLSNIKCIQITYDYTAIKAIGARGSFADRGATFGSNLTGGVCTCFHEPVGALLGPKVKVHPGLTMTVGDLMGLAEVLSERTALPVQDHRDG